MMVKPIKKVPLNITIISFSGCKSPSLTLGVFLWQGARQGKTVWECLWVLWELCILCDKSFKDSGVSRTYTKIV